MADSPSTTTTQQATGQGQASAPAAGVTIGPVSPLSLDEMLEAELAGQEVTQESQAPQKRSRKATRPAPKAQAKAKEEEIIDEIDDDLPTETVVSEEPDPENETDPEDEPEQEAPDSEEEPEAEKATDEDPPEDEPEAEDPGDEAPLEELPKSWQKNVKKLRAEAKSLRERLKAESARQAPTPESPLANVVTEDELTQTLANAKRMKQLFGKVSDSDYTEDHDGNEVFVITQGNQSYSYTKPQVQQMLAKAEQLLDPDVVLERRQYLATRNEINPLETAENIVPGIISDKDSPASQWLNRVLESVPGLRQLPDFEVLLAHAHRDYLRQQESLPTKTHPKGKVKWVRYELDKDGKVLPPKQKAAANGQQPAAPNGPSQRRAPVAPAHTAGKARVKLDHAMANGSSLHSTEEIASMLDAELAAS